MSLDTTRMLNIAEDLLKLHSEEAYRSAANRAYYSVFHECSKIGKKLSFSSYKNNFKHSELIQKLVTHPVKELRCLGKRLEQARDLRTKADYRDQDPFNFNQGASAVLTANSIMKGIKLIYIQMNLPP